jgi:hypothetical protein
VEEESAEESGGVSSVFLSWTDETTMGSDDPACSESAPMLPVPGSSFLSGGDV